MTSKRLIVVGAGASGMMAAGRAAQLVAEAGLVGQVEVVLLERMRQVGRKIRISGKGRCNLTNTLPTAEFIEHFGKGGRFLRQALARFFSDELVDFLNGRGLETVVERGGRIFPASGSAVAVAQTLEDWLRELNVKLVLGAHVRGLDTDDGGVSGLHYDLFDEHGKAGSGGDRGCRAMTADAIMLATGGLSYPATGSTGDGLRMASVCTHTIVEPRPSLVPLRADGAPPEGVRQLILRNVGASLSINGKIAVREFGELHFRETGLTGPIILELSRIAVAALDAAKRVELSLDLKPALDQKKLDARLIRDLEAGQVKTFGELVAGLLPRDLCRTALTACAVPADKPSHQVSSKERKALGSWLKDYRFLLSGYGTFKEAVVTAGGVATGEIDPRTMESRLQPGLYVIGELLDLDADTGGFNMMGAFSTGWVGGEAAVKRLIDDEAP